MKVGVSFEVGDHDFIKFNLVPSVTLVNTIPSEGEGAFESSSPARHVTKLASCLQHLY